MSFRLKLVGILLFVAVGPLLVSAVSSLRVHQQAFDGKVDELQRRAAEHGATIAALRLDELNRGLRLLVRDTIRWPALSPDERLGALWLAYRHHDDVIVTALLDEQGAGLGPSAYLGATTPDQPTRFATSPALLERFARSIPFDAARRDGAAVGAPIDAQGAGSAPLLPLAFRVPGPGVEPWTVAVLLSLRGVCADLTRAHGDELRVLLLDEEGRDLCPAEGAVASPRPSDPALAPELKQRVARVIAYRASDGTDLRAAIAPLAAPSRWSVVAQQPAAAALAAGRTIRARTIYWMGLSAVIALLAGTFLASAISRPVRTLSDGAREISRGNFRFRLAGTHSGDELGRLTGAFNQMCQEIEQRDAEIRGWNDQLQQRIEQRTAELRDTQQQLVQSQKIAAMASLGAGFAHEINNPLTSVLGLLQLLGERARSVGSDDASLLEMVEHEAQRIRATVETVLKLSSSYVGDGAEGFVDLDPQQLIDEALQQLEPRVKESGVEVVRDYAPDAPRIVGDAPQLREAVGQLVDNAVTAMRGRQGGRLTVATGHLDERRLVKIEIADTGVGIPAEHLERIFDPFYTTKEDWRGEGLGLTVVYRTVERHLGKIKAVSQVGEGTTITLTFPSAQRTPHLE